METVYIGKENVFKKQLTEDDVAVDLSAVTKVEIMLGGTLYDSDTYPSAFDYSTEAAQGNIFFKLGLIPAITESFRDKKAELVIYSPDYPQGYVWGLLDIQTLNVE